MAPRRERRQILPFRIPLFRIFYSVTYSALYLLTLVILAITPVSLLWTSIQHSALQYVFMIGGTYVLTLLVAIFIYSSRLYTNRAVLAAVGKAYIPVEEGEVSKGVRKMIVKQLERSAVVAWEGRPRDIHGEILQAEKNGVLPPESLSITRGGYVVGTIIPVDPDQAPWGDVQHHGWSSPSHARENQNPNVQFDKVVAELPHLIEARAVSLAPPDPTLSPVPDQATPADPAVVSILQRPATMALRDYLSQIGYLGLIQPLDAAQNFLTLYEKARFSGQPSSKADFRRLMDAFAQLLSGMAELDSAIVKEIRLQAEQRMHLSAPNTYGLPASELRDLPRLETPSPRASARSASHSPVTARERPSRSITPYTQQLPMDSEESLGSVIAYRPGRSTSRPYPEEGTRFSSNTDLSSIRSDIPSDAGSVLWHDTEMSYG